MEKTPCRSVFKNGTVHTTHGQVTQIWATLINQMEKANTLLTRGR